MTLIERLGLKVVRFGDMVIIGPVMNRDCDAFFLHDKELPAFIRKELK
jgi:hypothetical protein